MRRAFTLFALAMLVALTTMAMAEAAPARLTAIIRTPPEVQAIGANYLVKIIVRPHGTPIRDFCIDFEDDDGSWLVRVPGMRAYDDDVFCTPLLPGKKKTFTARIVPAKSGVHTLEIGVGHAELFDSVNNAVLDENSLWWSGDFVLR